MSVPAEIRYTCSHPPRAAYPANPERSLVYSHFTKRNLRDSAQAVLDAPKTSLGQGTAPMDASAYRFPITTKSAVLRIFTKPSCVGLRFILVDKHGAAVNARRHLLKVLLISGYPNWPQPANPGRHPDCQAVPARTQSIYTAALLSRESTARHARLKRSGAKGQENGTMAGKEPSSRLFRKYPDVKVVEWRRPSPQKARRGVIPLLGRRAMRYHGGGTNAELLD
ncbi:hypothetical protein Bbelb_264500 [Branchiostoma belcheri]|nr:hypothetical protein Bbelb_264500 [Branchiostoma belcheri]